MKITVNGKETETGAGNLHELAEEMNLPAQRTAIAVDNKMTPKSEWAQFPLRDGMRILIIKAACGG